ncbi:MAG: type II secretion system protein [Rickettsiales bacterium]|nr:type II secretion system protein [Rickettsiales bacterium]
MKNIHSHRHGFTLLELSVVLVIISVLLAGGATIFATSLQKRQLDETNAKMVAIQAALLDFRRANNRLPCPADITLGLTSASFGVTAAINGGQCSGGSPASNFTLASPLLAGGMVPVRTLNLPDDYAFDGWGRRILYVISSAYTATDAFSTYSITSPAAGATVYDGYGTAAGNTKISAAVYVLVSMGANGHGAYPRAGGSTRINTASANTYELENCECNSSGVSGTFDQYFHQKIFTLDPATANRTNDFDDIVVYASRGQVRSLNE